MSFVQPSRRSASLAIAQHEHSKQQRTTILMDTIEFRLTGTSPLMMNNPQTVNPFNPYTLQMKEITDKRKRSDEDLRDLLKIKFMAALYYDDKLGPYLPMISVWRSIHEAAKISRAGKTIERGLHTGQDMAAIEYPGPRTPEELYADPQFVDVRDASPSGKRVTACRPIFKTWALVGIVFLFEEAPYIERTRPCLHSSQLAGKLAGELALTAKDHP